LRLSTRYPAMAIDVDLKELGFRKSGLEVG
jgi:hypothetical protein